MSAMIVTSLGDIVMDLYTDRCPLTCKNFLKLCKIKYYNGCLFHTVQKDFTAQTGDPTGTGSGGDSVYKFLYGDQARFFGDEIHLDVKHSKIGIVSMASAGENLNASQFFITLRDDLEYLDGKHTVFGEVAEGLDTLTRINEAYVDAKGRPYKNIRIKHTYILDDPFEDPPQLAELIPDASPEGKPKDEVDDDVRLEDDWVPMDEQVGPQELEEAFRAKAAHSSAVVLESMGDIPDAEMKPPDNVLFVCKLNPVTEDDDLHTIFSRFGTVTSAEVIRDYKTGDSLCYAFIEFEDKDACEQAYFKMDNALIDDRRIHVDFSQSVAKLWSQYRRKGQAGKGGGCFKCGSLDHVAKDCNGDPTIKQQHSKYILKDDNTQHGGDDNIRFDMVFDEDSTGSPGQSKTRRDHKAENHDQKQHMKRGNSYDRKNQDDRRRDSHDLHKRGRNKDHKEDERLARRRMSPYEGRERDYPAKEAWDRGRKADGAGSRNRADEEEYKKRRADDADHKEEWEKRDYEKSHADAGHRYKQGEREYKERHVDVGRGDRNNGRDSKRSIDDDLRGSHRDEVSYDNSRRGIRGESNNRMMHEDHKRRGEERFADTRSSKDDRIRDHVRDRDRDRDRGRRN